MIVRSEDAKWIKNIGVYFAILKEINEDLLKLIKYDSNYNEKIELLFFEIAVNLNRIFPLKYKKISDDDGILKLKKYIDFLKTDYKNIYYTYKDSIITINDVRNKFEHVPHIIKWHQYVGNNKEKTLWFINDEYNSDIIEGNEKEIEKKEKKNERLEWKINTDMFVEIVISLDKVFIKIQNKLNNYFKDNMEALTHPYISNILNLNISKYIDELNNI